MAKQATHASTHSTPLALAQHTSTGTALHFNWHSNCIWQNKLHMQQHTAHHLHWHSTLQLVRHCASTGTAIAYGKTCYICNSTQHTICIGTAHFNWYGIALQLAQQLHMAKQVCDSTQPHHYIENGTSITLTKQATRVHITARQLHMAKQATYATAHSTPLALAQHTSTGMALHFNLHSNCIWQNKLHMQQHAARHLHQHSTLQLARHCTSTGTAIAYGKTSYICDSAHHTICIGTAHFNWHGTAFQLVQQLHMAKTSYMCVNTQHTICIGTEHFNWHSVALQLAQRLRVANKLHM